MRSAPSRVRIADSPPRRLLAADNRRNRTRAAASSFRRARARPGRGRRRVARACSRRVRPAAAHVQDVIRVVVDDHRHRRVGDRAPQPLFALLAQLFRGEPLLFEARSIRPPTQTACSGRDREDDEQRHRELGSYQPRARPATRASRAEPAGRRRRAAGRRITSPPGPASMTAFMAPSSGRASTKPKQSSSRAVDVCNSIVANGSSPRKHIVPEEERDDVEHREQGRGRDQALSQPVAARSAREEQGRVDEEQPDRRRQGNAAGRRAPARSRGIDDEQVVDRRPAECVGHEA